MSYVDPNFRTKKALKEALAAGEEVHVYQPNSDITGAIIPRDGRVFLEGPHYPELHRWYASGEMKEGKLVKLV